MVLKKKEKKDMKVFEKFTYESAQKVNSVDFHAV